MPKVYIKDFEMPKNCDECTLREFNMFQAGMHCKITGFDVLNQKYAKERHEKCPLKEED